MSASARRRRRCGDWPPGVSAALAKSNWTSTVTGRRSGRRGPGPAGGLGGEDRVEAGAHRSGPASRRAALGVGRVGLKSASASARSCGRRRSSASVACSAASSASLAASRAGRSSSAVVALGDGGLQRLEHAVADRERRCGARAFSASRVGRARRSGGRRRASAEGAASGAGVAATRLRGGSAARRRRGAAGWRAARPGGRRGVGGRRRRARRGRNGGVAGCEKLLMRGTDAGKEQRRSAANIGPLAAHACSCPSACSCCCGNIELRDSAWQRFIVGREFFCSENATSGRFGGRIGGSCRRRRVRRGGN